MKVSALFGKKRRQKLEEEIEERLYNLGKSGRQRETKRLLTRLGKKLDSKKSNFEFSFALEEQAEEEEPTNLLPNQNNNNNSEKSNSKELLCKDKKEEEIFIIVSQENDQALTSPIAKRISINGNSTASPYLSPSPCQSLLNLTSNTSAEGATKTKKKKKGKKKKKNGVEPELERDSETSKQVEEKGIDRKVNHIKQTEGKGIQKNENNTSDPKQVALFPDSSVETSAHAKAVLKCKERALHKSRERLNKCKIEKKVNKESNKAQGPNSLRTKTKQQFSSSTPFTSRSISSSFQVTQSLAFTSTKNTEFKSWKDNGLTEEERRHRKLGKAIKNTRAIARSRQRKFADMTNNENIKGPTELSEVSVFTSKPMNESKFEPVGSTFAFGFDF